MNTLARCLALICVCSTTLADDVYSHARVENGALLLYAGKTVKARVVPDRFASDGEELHQAGFSAVTFSQDRRSVGWLSLYPNCCTSYPIPLKLTVLASGKRHEFTGNGLPIFSWKFVGEKAVAFYQDTTHGAWGTHYELWELNGKRIATWEPERGEDHRILSGQTPPEWAKALKPSPL